MKKIIFSLIMLFTVLGIQAQGRGVMNIDGYNNSFDTLVFRNIGPGMTYTKVSFPYMYKSGYRMIVAYVTIDMTNPNNSHTSYIANDKFYTAHSQLDEYNRQINLGKKAVATVMGGAFVQVNTTDPLRPAWEVSGGVVSDGRLLTNPSGDCYYVDDSNNACVGNVKLTANAVTANGVSIPITNINRYRGRSNGVTLFCNNYEKSRDSDSGAGTEILLSLIGDNKVGTNGTYRCKVENVYTGTNHSFLSNQIILSAKGDAEKQLTGIAVGDEITLNVSCTDETGNALSIMQSSSPLFGYGVKNGVAQGSTMRQYAQCAFGVSQNGDTSYWFLLENSENSNAPVSLLNEFMANLGVWDAMLMDGGPSAEMTIDGEWATPNSIGGNFNGRNVPCGLIAYSIAPDDNTLASVDFKDIKVEVNKGSAYAPKFYGLNQYGEVISNNAEKNPNSYITCDPSIGSVSDDGKSFTPTTGKSGYIYGHVKGSDAVSKMWVEVRTVSKIAVEPKHFFTEEGRGTNAALYVIESDGTKTAINADAASWTATNKWVCDVDETGYLFPKEDNDGEEALVIAEYLGMKDTIYVTVETVNEDFVNNTSLIEKTDDINLQLPGIPTSFTIKLKSDGATSAVLTYTAGLYTHIEAFENMTAGETVTRTVSLPSTEIDEYPITLVGFSTIGGNISVEKFIVYYHSKTETETIEAIHIDPKSFFTTAGRGRQAKVTMERTDKSVEPLEPSEVEWTSDNNAICAVDDKGYLTPDMEGNISITAEYLGFKDAMAVTVENQSEDELPLINAIDDIDIDNINLVLPSIPTSFLVRTVTDSEAGADITIIYKKGVTQCEEKLGFIAPGTTTSTIVTLDADDFDAYPVTIEKIVVDGAPIQLQALTALYHGAEPTPPATAITTASEDLGIAVSRKGCDVMVTIPDGDYAECRVLSLDGRQLTSNIKVQGTGSPATICQTQTTPLLVIVNFKGNRYVHKIQ